MNKVKTVSSDMAEVEQRGKSAERRTISAV